MHTPPPEKKVPACAAGDRPSLDQNSAQRSAFYQALRAAKSRTLERAVPDMSGDSAAFDLLQPVASSVLNRIAAQFDEPEAAVTAASSSDCSASSSAHCTQAPTNNISQLPEHTAAKKNLQQKRDQDGAHQRPTAPTDIAEWLTQHLIQLIAQRFEHRTTVWSAIVPLNPAVLPRTCAEIAADHEMVAIVFRTAMPPIHQLLNDHAEFFRHRISRVIVRTVLINIVYDPTVAEPQQSSNR